MNIPKLVTGAVLQILLACASVYGQQDPVTPDEVEVLRFTAETMGALFSCDTMTLDRTLETQGDKLSELLLSNFLTMGIGSCENDRWLANALLATNPFGTRLSDAEIQSLGQRRSRLFTNVECKLQLSRVGWSSDRRHALVYVGLRRGSLPGAALVELERQEEGWKVAREWAREETIVLD